MTEKANEIHISGTLIEALRLGTPLTVEVTASTPERLAGVTVFPQRCVQDQLAKKEGWKASVHDRTFKVVWREYSRRYLENDWDLDLNYGMWELKQMDVVGEQALERLLQEWGIPLRALTYLWKSNIPR